MMRYCIDITSKTFLNLIIMVNYNYGTTDSAHTTHHIAHILEPIQQNIITTNDTECSQSNTNLRTKLKNIISKIMILLFQLLFKIKFINTLGIKIEFYL